MLNIKVNYLSGSKAILVAYKDNVKFLEVDAFVGKNGVTDNHVEGDLKTPIGTFEIGEIFGMHQKEDVNLKNYIEVNENLYWVDDLKSTYYNRLVNIKNIVCDFKTAEHLIEFPIEYEYAMEIKANPKNIPGKGSAIFLHCSNNKATCGCIAIEKRYMKQIIDKMYDDEKIIISINK